MCKMIHKFQTMFSNRQYNLNNGSYLIFNTYKYTRGQLRKLNTNKNI